MNLTILLLRRSREGAWIEIQKPVGVKNSDIVAPARERGLKYMPAPAVWPADVSLPRGSVD